MDRSDPVALVGDVGGTNCRLALMSPDGKPLARWRCGTEDFPGPEEAIKAFLATQQALLRDHPVIDAAMAIAAPTGVDRVQLTNSPWRFDRHELKRSLRVRRFLLINDLAAQARAVMDAPAGYLEPIGGAPLTALSGVVAVVGPGTGLGVARLDMTSRHVAATEGGHVGFAPNDDLELALLQIWRSELGRVTNEHVVSGPGLVRVFQALAEVRGAPVAAIDGPEIMRRALADLDPICVETVDRFARILGAVCADIVLAQGADSLALVGGIPEAMLPVLRQGGFRSRFEQRGPGGAYLAGTPSVLVAMPDLGLRGALACLQDAAAVEEHS